MTPSSCQRIHRDIQVDGAKQHGQQRKHAMSAWPKPGECEKIYRYLCIGIILKHAETNIGCVANEEDARSGAIGNRAETESARGVRCLCSNSGAMDASNNEN